MWAANCALTLWPVSSRDRHSLQLMKGHAPCDAPCLPAWSCPVTSTVWVQVRFAILDEADRMLSDGFEEDVERILETSPVERQTLLFSATMPTWVKKLTRRFQKNPIMVDLVGDDNAGKMNECIKCVFVTVWLKFLLSNLVTICGLVHFLTLCGISAFFFNMKGHTAM